MDKTPAPGAGTRAEHLFIVRLWHEQANTGEGQWRGSVDHVPSGQRHYFAKLADLTEFIMARTERT